MQTFISFVFVFGMLVFFHEFGHFAIAKLNGIKVHKFALGMGPKLFSYQGKETEYSIRILPIGGYVKMEGEDEASDNIGSFSSKTPLQRIAVLAAGPIMNIVLALLLFTIISMNIGTPVNIIDKVSENSPAEIAGLQSGDEIVKINESDIRSWEDIVDVIGSSDSDVLSIMVMRKGSTLNIDVKPEFDEASNRRLIGISPTFRKSLLASIQSSFKTVVLILSQIGDFLFNLIRGQGSTEGVVGPVGMVQFVGEAARTGILNLLSLAGIISINLAILNILPFPALDGGRIIFALIELIKGTPVDPNKEGFVHLVGFVILMILMVLVLYKDIVKLNIL